MAVCLCKYAFPAHLHTEYSMLNMHLSREIFARLKKVLDTHPKMSYNGRYCARWIFDESDEREGSTPTTTPQASPLQNIVPPTLWRVPLASARFQGTPPPRADSDGQGHENLARQVSGPPQVACRIQLFARAGIWPRNSHCQTGDASNLDRSSERRA